MVRGESRSRSRGRDRSDSEDDTARLVRTPHRTPKADNLAELHVEEESGLRLVRDVCRSSMQKAGPPRDALSQGLG